MDGFPISYHLGTVEDVSESASQRKALQGKQKEVPQRESNPSPALLLDVVWRRLSVLEGFGRLTCLIIDIKLILSEAFMSGPEGFSLGGDTLYCTGMRVLDLAVPQIETQAINKI